MTIWQRITGLATTLGEARADAHPEDAQRLQYGAGASEAPVDASTSVAFTIAVIALGAKMAKADGVVLPVEVEAFYQVFRIAPAERAHADQVFQLAQGDIAGFESYADQIRALLGGDRQRLRDVIESLFHIASADRALHPGEDQFLNTVAHRFGFSDTDYRHIRAQFVEDRSEPYDVLGLVPSATDAQLKARYHKLVRENHPDLLAGRGVPAALIKVADRKLAAITSAYAALAKERGL